MELNIEIGLNIYKAFCQWKQFFSHASDGLENEVHPLEECGAKHKILVKSVLNQHTVGTRLQSDDVHLR